jgi:tellurite resistance protein
MKILIALTTLAAIATSSADAEARPVNKRVDRIEIAVQTGELTRGEVKRLRAEQRELATALRIAQADGRLSRAEREQLDRLENQFDRRLTRYGHNDRSRR